MRGIWRNAIQFKKNRTEEGHEILNPIPKPFELQHINLYTIFNLVDMPCSNLHDPCNPQSPHNPPTSPNPYNPQEAEELATLCTSHSEASQSIESIISKGRCMAEHAGEDKHVMVLPRLPGGMACMIASF